MAFGFSCILFDINFVRPLKSMGTIVGCGHCCRCHWLLITERDCTLLNLYFSFDFACFMCSHLLRCYALAFQLALHVACVRVLLPICSCSIPFPESIFLIEALALLFFRWIFNCFIPTRCCLLHYKSLKLAGVKQVEIHITDIARTNGEKWWWAIEYQSEFSGWYGCHCYIKQCSARWSAPVCVSAQTDTQHIQPTCKCIKIDLHMWRAISCVGRHPIATLPIRPLVSRYKSFTLLNVMFSMKSGQICVRPAFSFIFSFRLCFRCKKNENQILPARYQFNLFGVRLERTVSTQNKNTATTTSTSTTT